jgi:Tol biopolymer transport system component
MVDRRLLVLGAAAAGLLAILLDAAATIGDALPARPEIAFASERHGNTDIYLIRTDGTGLRRLTRSRGRDASPTWSPDGSQIAFRSDRDGNDEIYVMNADGSNQRNLTQNPATDYSPAWSPDGREIAFASDRGGDATTLNDIWVMDADGASPRQLESHVGIDEYPVWSPDGSTIAFACTNGVILPQRVGDFEVCSMHADGTGITRLTDAPGITLAWSWSPDGRRIALDSSRRDHPIGLDEGGDLLLIDPDGSNLVALTRGPALDAQPVFSPNGKQIAFTSNRGRHRRYGLFLMRADGSHIRPLTHGPGQDADPAWRT